MRAAKALRDVGNARRLALKTGPASYDAGRLKQRPSSRRSESSGRPWGGDSNWVVIEATCQQTSRKGGPVFMPDVHTGFFVEDQATLSVVPVVNAKGV
jgi:hypothetical protein